MGDIRFGMSRTEVDTFADVVGTIDSTHDPAEAALNFEATLGPLKDLFDPADLATAAAALRGVADQRPGALTEYRSSGLILDFTDKGLTEIGTDQRCTKATVGGVPLFAAPPFTVIAAIRDLVGEPPLLRGVDVGFRKYAIYLNAFLYDEPGYPASPDEEARSERMISWRAAPPGPLDDWAGFTPLAMD